MSCPSGSRGSRPTSTTCAPPSGTRRRRATPRWRSGWSPSLWRFWAARGNLSEWRALATAALATGEGPPELRVRAVNAAGVLASEQGDFAAAQAHFEEGLELARALGARDRIASSGSNLANLAIYAGDYATAIGLYEEATVIARELGDERLQSLMLQNLGLAHEGAGHRERAVPLLEESLALARRVADPAHITSTQSSLARVLLDDDPPRAHDLLRESLKTAQQLGDRTGIVFSPRDRRAGGLRPPHGRATARGRGRPPRRGRSDPPARRGTLGRTRPHHPHRGPRPRSLRHRAHRGRPDRPRSDRPSRGQSPASFSRSTSARRTASTPIDALKGDCPR